MKLCPDQQLVVTCHRKEGSANRSTAGARVTSKCALSIMLTPLPLPFPPPPVVLSCLSPRNTICVGAAPSLLTSDWLEGSRLTNGEEDFLYVKMVKIEYFLKPAQLVV